MRDRWLENPEEESFTALVGAGIKDLRDQRGPCPDAGTLVDFHHHTLSHEQLTAVQNHVAVCGLCDLALGRLAAAEAASDSEEKGSQRPFWGRLWNPLLAYGLVVVLAYPAYLGIESQYHRRPLAAPLESALSVPSFDIDSERGAGASDKPHTVRLLGQDKSFLLVFLIPMKPGAAYFAEVRRQGSPEVVVPRQRLSSGEPPGRVALLCRRDFFAAGDYRLTVFEGDSTIPRFEYVFHVE